MKQYDPNHYKGSPSHEDGVYGDFNYGIVEKTVIKSAQLYMRRMTKKFLDFSYGSKEAAPPEPEDKKNYLLYLHIPFCKTLCPYCSFHKFKFKEETAKQYFELLRSEMLLAKKKGFDFISLYIGGGTTTILPHELVKTVKYAKELFGIKEVTCEADPLIDDELVKLLSPHIDRISIGLQTTDDGILKKIRRYKKFGSSDQQINNISKAIRKFPIVNVDLIFNLPGQTKEQLKKDIQTVKEVLDPQQVSYYPLMYSPSVKKSIERNLGRMDNSSEIEFYKLIMKGLKQSYNMLSSWTFAKKEIKTFDEYVVEYNEYLGLGSGSFSFIKDTLYINTFSLQEYKKKVSNEEFSIQRFKRYEKDDILRYQLLLDLFSNSFSKEKYLENYGVDIISKFKWEFRILRWLGILKKDSYKTTPFGSYFFLTLMKEFYIGMDYVRETSKKRLSKKDSSFS